MKIKNIDWINVVIVTIGLLTITAIIAQFVIKMALYIKIYNLL